MVRLYNTVIACQCKCLYIIIAGVDYGQRGVTSYPVMFSPGSIMQSIMIPIINDNIREGNENFRVAIDPLSMLGVIIGTPNASIITIIETTGKIVLIYVSSQLCLLYRNCCKIFKWTLPSYRNFWRNGSRDITY